jgi:hypothetical protein
MRDEGAPLDAGSQVQASNHCKLLPSKAKVVSCVKKTCERHAIRELEVGPSEPSCRGRLQTTTRRCCLRTVVLSVVVKKGAASEPLMACRNVEDCVKIEVCLVPGISLAAVPKSARAVSGLQAARNRIRLLYGT